MQPINVYGYQALAKAKMDPIGWDYYDGGSDDEVTLRENRAPSSASVYALACW